MEKLREDIIEIILRKLEHYDLFVPYQDGEVHSKILNNTNIVKTTNHDQGIFYRIRTPEFVFNRLNIGNFTLGTEHEYL